MSLRRPVVSCTNLEPLDTDRVAVANGIQLASTTAAAVAAATSVPTGRLIWAHDTGELYYGVPPFASYTKAGVIPRVTGTATAVSVGTTAGNYVASWGTPVRWRVPNSIPQLWHGYGAPYALIKTSASGVTAGDRVVFFGNTEFGSGISAEADSTGAVSASVLTPLRAVDKDFLAFQAVATGAGAITATTTFEHIALGSCAGRYVA